MRIGRGGRLPLRLMCPLLPSAKPSRAKMRKAAAICSSCQRRAASLVSGTGISWRRLTLPLEEPESSADTGAGAGVVPGGVVALGDIVVDL